MLALWPASLPAMCSARLHKQQPNHRPPKPPPTAAEAPPRLQPPTPLYKCTLLTPPTIPCLKTSDALYAVCLPWNTTFLNALVQRVPRERSIRPSIQVEVSTRGG